MAIGINGTSNTITGLAVGGLPDGTVDADTLASNAVTTAKIADSTGASDGITTAKIADTAVTLAKLEHGTGSNDGKFLRANNGADPSFETVNTDLVADTTPQLGGNLDVNAKNIEFGDSGSTNDDRLFFGASGDMSMWHDASHSYINNATGTLHIRGQGDGIKIQKTDGEDIAKFIPDGAVELYHNNVKKLETVSGGATITGTCTATAFAGDGSALTGIAGIPSGVIVMWSGASNAIPTGFVLCNGSNSTPDLRNRFVIGATDTYAVGATGGATSNNTNTTSGFMYTGSEDNPNQVQDASSSYNGIENKNSRDRHQHGVDTSHNHSVSVLPPYYALCYIMKS